MTVSAAQADAFYSEILANREVWAIRDEIGFPAPESGSRRAIPFWSLRSRAMNVINTAAEYRGFEPVAIPLEQWQTRWLPGLRKDGLLVGLNWSGLTVTGYDVSPDDVERNLNARRT